MRSIRMSLLAAFCGLAQLTAGESAAKFSGTWKMDPARSESAHQDVPGGASRLVIQLTDTGLTMETTRAEEGKPVAFHEKLNLKLDGSETVSQGDSETPVTAKVHWDGPKLVVETSRILQNSTVTTVYVHSISPNGREMTVDKTLTVQHGYQGVTAAPNSGHGKDVFVRAGD